MSVRNLQPLLAPRSIAVFGASERPGSLGAAVMRNLLAGGFAGPVWPVNPRHASVMGLPCAARAADLPEPPDLAVIVAPGRVVPRTVAALGRRGGRIALVLTPDLGPGGREATLAAARPHLLRIIGPDSLGLLVPALGLNASLAHLPAAPGGIALVAQSAAIAATLIDWAAERDIGFSQVLDLGDMADVDAGDALDLLAGDGRTRAVLLQLEEAAHSRKLLSAARAAARIKPVIALLTRAARLAPGPDANPAERLLAADPAGDIAADAALRRAGVLRVRGLAELFAAAEAVARFRPSERARAAIVSNGTGAARLVADGLAEAGGALAPAGPDRPNPLDLGGAATPGDYVAALAAAAADPEVDVLLAVNAPSGVADGEAAAAAIAAEVAAGRFGGKPLLACWLGGVSARAARGALRAAGAPAFDDPAATGRAVAHLAAWGRAQAALLRVPDRAAEDASGPAPAEAAAAGRAALRAAAAEGRTRIEGAAAGALLAAYGLQLAPGAAEPLAREVMIGMARDPDFGPVLLCGAGGAAAALPLPPAAELPPIDATLAAALVARSPAAALLADAPDGAAAALARALVALSHMVEDLPALRAAAIDPLRIGPAGAAAGEARIDFDPGRIDRAAPNPDLAIRPYPGAWKRVAELKGEAYAIRPILPVDVLLYPDFLARLDAEDIRMRFMAPRRNFPDEMGLRLTQLDYDRDMAFVAIAPDGSLAGVSRLSSDPDRETAEYALVVRSDLAGRGLGTALMRQLIDYARADGIRRLEGMVLAENRGMRGLIGRLGFRIEPMPEEPGVVMSRLELRPPAEPGR